MSSINWKMVLTHLDGAPLKAEDRPLGVVRIGDVAIDALCVVLRDEQNVSGTEKCRRGDLAQKIFSAMADDALPVKLPVEDIALIKDLIGKLFTPLIVWQCWQALENGSA